MLSLNGLGELDECELSRAIRQSENRLVVLVNIPCLYADGSRWNIAEARLAVWYIAEMFAQVGSNVTIEEAEQDDGSGNVRFSVDVSNSEELSSRLVWLASAFDPDTDDDGTGRFDFSCEIEGWLDEHRSLETCFPDLKEAFEIDAAAAREQDDLG